MIPMPGKSWNFKTQKSSPIFNYPTMQFTTKNNNPPSSCFKYCTWR